MKLTKNGKQDTTMERLVWAVLTAALSGAAITGFQHYVDTKYDLTKRVEAVEQTQAAGKQLGTDTVEWLKRIDGRLEGIEGALRRK